MKITYWTPFSVNVYLFLLSGLLTLSLAAQPTSDYPADSLLQRFLDFETSDPALSQRAYAQLDRVTHEWHGRFRHDRVERSMKRLFASVHDEFFVRYVDNPIFADIFTKGEYNCVTASALYSILFERLGIPYEIRELPTHVYVVAYPDTYQLIVESTLPAEGIIEIRDRQVKAYRKELLANKMVSEEELRETDDVFSLMQQDSVITLQNLYGIQLFNRSLVYLEQEDYRRSVELLQRAKTHHDRDYLDFTILANLGFLAHEPSRLSAADRCFIIEVFATLPDEFSEEEVPAIMAVFHDFTGEVSTASLARLANETADCIDRSAVPQSLKDAVANATGIYRALYYYNALQLDTALRILADTYEPSNTNAYRLIKQVFIDYAKHIQDPYAVLDTLGRYQQLFPFLAADETMQLTRGGCYLQIVSYKFELGEPAEGLEYLDKFEQVFSPADAAILNPDIIGVGYGAVSAYYVRQGQEEEALRWIERGLEYAEHSLELNRKKKLLESDTW